MTTIYLIRHGHTDWTGKRLIGNLPGVHLDQIGRDQAERVATYLEPFPIEAIYASPMERTMETAAPFSEKKGLTTTPVEFLRETIFGELQGMTAEQLHELPVWQQFLSHPAQVKFPGGESVAEAQQRIATGLDSLVEKHGTDTVIACFAHCEILRLAVACALNMPLDDFKRLTIDTGSISCLEWNTDGKSLIMLNLIP